jgi:hypothetical protein
LLVHRQNHERAVVELDQPPRTLGAPLALAMP